MWVEQHWGPLLGGSHGKSVDRGVEGWGGSSCSLAMPPTRKVVSSSVSRVGSLPKSSPKPSLTCFFFQSLGVYSSMGSCRGTLWFVWECHLSKPYSRIFLVLGADRDPQGSNWATHLQDMIMEDLEKETGAFLETKASGSSVFVNGSNSWSGNATPLIAHLMDVIWDIWPPLLSEARLKEAGLICRSIPYFIKWA